MSLIIPFSKRVGVCVSFSERHFLNKSKMRHTPNKATSLSSGP